MTMRSPTAAAALALLLLACTAGIQCARPLLQSEDEVDCSNPPPQAPVDLGNASAFVVLAGHEVTTGAGVASRILGDLGVSPGNSVTGQPDMLEGSVIQKANGASAAGIRDLGIAYNDAAGRTVCPILVAGELGGMTLYPGLYKSSSGLEITDADLTLSGDGIFIFQMATTFLMTKTMKVTLTNGAQAKNIFWQVGTSATLMDKSVLYGTILADQSITSGTGAVIHGRALARIASVTMESAVFSLPAE
ncbi:hypothetical protein FOA52_000734 [Chlamydomonas sp. UWO 241]|nr:hypothetical protein FOA52_000734 [Chlamydomonas sp. UWO 241]